MTRRPVLAAALAAALTLGLSGCGLGQGLYGVNLPGGADLGDHSYHVTAKFSDVLDLVPQAAVKVNDVPVGRVDDITLEPSGTIADVDVELNGDVTLPANAVAAIAQTSLLGEKYVSLAPPLTVPAQGTLRNGAVIDAQHTSTGVEVEEVFGALSLLLNGGGLGKLRDIYTELNAFAGGHEDGIRTFLTDVSTTVRTLNERKQSIIAALDALATLSKTLNDNNKQITAVLSSFAPGIAVLADQRQQLTTLLESLTRLSTVTVATLDKSRHNIVDDLGALTPVLQQLAAAGDSLPQSLQILATYPFPDSALAGIKGDYLNSWVKLVLKTPGGSEVAASWPSSGSGAVASGGTSRTASAASGSASSSASPTLIGPPPALLPATSAAAPGMSSTITLTPSRSGSGSPSASASSSASTTTSGSASPSGSSTGSGGS